LSSHCAQAGIDFQLATEPCHLGKFIRPEEKIGGLFLVTSAQNLGREEGLSFFVFSSATMKKMQRTYKLYVTDSYEAKIFLARMRFM
jgi:hypothetical protein